MMTNSVEANLEIVCDFQCLEESTFGNFIKFKPMAESFFSPQSLRIHNRCRYEDNACFFISRASV